MVGGEHSVRRGGQAGGDRRAASREAGRSKDVDIEDDKSQGFFYIYSRHLKGYVLKWHNLTSLGC